MSELQRLLDSLPDGVMLVIMRDKQDKGVIGGWTMEWVARCAQEPDMLDISMHTLSSMADALEALVDQAKQSGGLSN